MTLLQIIPHRAGLSRDLMYSGPWCPWHSPKWISDQAGSHCQGTSSGSSTCRPLSLSGPKDFCPSLLVSISKSKILEIRNASDISCHYCQQECLFLSCYRSPSLQVWKSAMLLIAAFQCKVFLLFPITNLDFCGSLHKCRRNRLPGYQSSLALLQMNGSHM